MSTTSPMNPERSNTSRRHRSYRDRTHGTSQPRITVPVSDPAPPNFAPPPPEFERQPLSSRGRISHPRKPSRRNTGGSTRYQPTQLPGIYSHGVAHHVATGQVGLDYGPYQYHPGEMVRPRGRLRKEQPPDPEQQVTSPNPKTTLSSAAAGAPRAVLRRNHAIAAAERPESLPNSATVPQYVWQSEKQQEAYHDQGETQEFSPLDLISWRGFLNVGALALLATGLLFIFALWPVLDHFVFHPPQPFGMGVNASGQVPLFQSFPSLIDNDTPESAYTRVGHDGHEYELVFSDEFSVDGRSFYPGDDPYWEAVDLHYWPTGNLEWYDPQPVTTKDGHLVITLNETNIHDLDYMGGMVTTWNKLCFTTGYVETSISLPGSARVAGLWPGAWTLGNLGRAGYGASTEGMWPYSYDSCDVGTFPNQTTRDGKPPEAVTGGLGGQPLSYQPGQRVSSCTCPGHDHPGPTTSKGRGVPEIDILEAQVNLALEKGEVSQSFQIAPFDYRYYFKNSSPATIIYDDDMTEINSYRGGQFQQAISALTLVDGEYYAGNAFASFAYEWWSNPDNREEGFITWYSTSEPTWTVTAASVGPDETVNINSRLIPEEPMYLILNLGMSNFFQEVDFDNLEFPVSMLVDYVRIYQRKGLQDALTCDPPGYPTKDYIDNHLNAYMNPNLTTWAQAGYTFPRNSLYDGCE